MNKETNKPDNAMTHQPHSPEGAKDLLAAYREDLHTAERVVGRSVDYSRHLPLILVGLLLPLAGIFLPHTGDVYGFDVLLSTPAAEAVGTSLPERIYACLSFTTILLAIGTIASKAWMVAWVTWAFSGVGWWYAVIAIWMLQTRPEENPGAGPAYGLALSLVGLILLFISMSIVLFRRTALQRALAVARREEAHKDEASRAAQQRLRTGLAPVPQEEIVDDRRARARARRRRSGQE